MNVEGIGDRTVEAVSEHLDTLEAAAHDRRIDEAEQARVVEAIGALEELRPLLVEIAVTLRAIAQLSKAGVSRYPHAPMRREIAEVLAMRQRAAGVVVLSDRRREKNRIAGSNNDAA